MSLETQLLMKQLMKQYFYLLNGKRPAKVIDIDAGVGQWDRVKTKTCQIKGHPTISQVYITNRAETSFANIACAGGYIGAFSPVNNYIQFLTAGVNKRTQFLGYLDGHLELLRIQNQYVYLYNLPTSDPVEAGALWNDAGTIKISSGV